MKRRTVASGVAAALWAAALAGCGSDPPQAAGPTTPAVSGRPTTKAVLTVVAPANGAVVPGPDVAVVCELVGGRILPASELTVAPDAGHIHLSVDGKVVTLASGLTDTVTGLTPGPHTLEAEFVAADHAPFANRVTARTLFEVRG